MRVLIPFVCVPLFHRVSIVFFFRGWRSFDPCSQLHCVGFSLTPTVGPCCWRALAWTNHLSLRIAMIFSAIAFCNLVRHERCSVSQLVPAIFIASTPSLSTMLKLGQFDGFLAVQLPSSFAFGSPLPRSVHPLVLHIEASLLRALLLSSSLVASVPFLPPRLRAKEFRCFSPALLH